MTQVVLKKEMLSATKPIYLYKCRTPLGIGLTILSCNTHVSCVPKKNTWYLLEGDFTAPSGNSSICKLGRQQEKRDADESLKAMYFRQ